MSSASDRRARVGTAVDRAWGEQFLLDPRCRPEGDPDGRPVQDPARPTFPFVGRFLSHSEAAHARSRATSLQATKPFTTANPTITVQKAVLLAPIVEDDVLLRMETGERFTVTRVADGRFDRLTLTLRSGPA